MTPTDPAVCAADPRLFGRECSRYPLSNQPCSTVSWACPRWPVSLLECAGDARCPGRSGFDEVEP